MGAVAIRRLRQLVAALAVLLLAMIAVQAPIEQNHLDLDRFQTVQANGDNTTVAADASPLEFGRVQAPDDPFPAEAPGAGGHHHHADGPPIQERGPSAAAPTLAMISAARFQVTNDLRPGLDSNPQDRPPRPVLEPVA